MKFLLISVCTLLSFSSNAQDSSHIQIKIIDSVSKSKILLLVQVKNEAVRSRIINNPRTIDFTSKSSKALGNYIIELQKETEAGYILFPPSSDWDPVPSNEFLVIHQGEVIKDTLILDGRSWGRRGFLKGNYRLRVAFNWTIWNPSSSNMTEWIEFAID